MKFRAVPQTDLIVSEIGFGARGLARLASPVDAVTAKRLVRQAYDQGINFFDASAGAQTAVAESILALALKGLDRRNVLIATSCAADVSRAAGLEAGCEASLRRLGVETIDIFQIAPVGNETDSCERLARVLARLKARGKIRTAGLVVSPDHFSEVKALLETLDFPVIQTAFDLLDQDVARHTSLLERRVGRQTGWIVRSPAASAAGGDLSAVEFLWSGNGKSPECVAAQFALTKPWVCSAVVDIVRDSDVPAYAAVPTLAPLTTNEIAVIDGLCHDLI